MFDPILGVGIGTVFGLVCFVLLPSLGGWYRARRKRHIEAELKRATDALLAGASLDRVLRGLSDGALARYEKIAAEREKLFAGTPFEVPTTTLYSLDAVLPRMTEAELLKYEMMFRTERFRRLDIPAKAAAVVRDQMNELGRAAREHLGQAPLTPDEQIDAYLAKTRCSSCRGEGCPDCVK